METKVVMMTIAVLGGTGKEGKGLVFRWAKAGYRVLIGSRTPEKAQYVACELTTLLGGTVSIEGCSNQDAARRADIVALAVPYSVHRATLESVKVR
jgi:8-hydroxy-5-deazaflavin:NADPH oxidoreductase